jgi:mannose-6-phosphate isomerase-like protein (cupin superfamily)
VRFSMSLPVTALSVFACAAVAQTSATPALSPGRGLVLAPGSGERLTYCARPLVLTLKVDSATASGTRLLAGVGELRGDEGFGRHRSADEILYVSRGWGYAMVGGDTMRLGPGSLVHVPAGVRHHLVSTGAMPMEYMFVLGESSSAEGFRRAAAVGCADDVGRLASPTSAWPSPATDAGRGVAFDPGSGDRITYCRFPLVITAKVDSESVPSGRLTAATGSLRRGAEVGAHRAVDEVVFFTHGRGRAFIGTDTTAVEAGSVTFVPQGTLHGFVNDTDDTLDYVIVYSASFSRAAFRRLASQPGPYCPT